MISDTFNQCIEQLCQQGCNAVRRVIDELQQGFPVPEAVQLSQEEQRTLLQELQEIMSVYDNRDCRK